MERFLIPLDRDPSIQISCSYYPPPERPSPRETLVVFLNSLDNSQSFWGPTIASLLKPRRRPNSTPILTYDRPGQGSTNGKNADVSGRPKGHGRDCLDAAYDLRELIEKVGSTRLGIDKSDIDSLGIVFVAASIGVAIARLYAAEYPGTVTACLFMDSTLANSDAVSTFPDPHAPGFNELNLPHGITTALLDKARKGIGRVFHHEVLNKEGLWRGTLPDLLPYSDAPQLVGLGPRTPYLTVVQHDPAVFTEQWGKLMGIHRRISEEYGEPTWLKYHEGLTRLTKPHLSKGPLIAKNSGHIIHKDNPRLVTDEVRELLDKLSRDEGSRM